MSVASSSTPLDPWDSTAPGPIPQRQVATVQTAVPDDWDDDNEDVDDPQMVWETANKKAPMPELVISGSSTTTTVVSPPPAAFQPTMRILKRPTNSPSSTSASTPSPDTQRSYAEREAQYQAARQRIFQDSATNGSAANGHDRGLESEGPRPRDGGASSPPAVSVKILREPRGPGLLPSEEKGATQSRSPSSQRSRGFAGRRNPRGPQARGKSGDKAA